MLNKISKFLRSIGVISILIISSFVILISFASKTAKPYDGFKPLYDFISSFEEKFYDYRLQTSLKNNRENDNIVLVAIDDESLQKINSWPIPRENYAKAVDNLNTWGARTVVFDVLFPEPVLACGEVSSDDILAESFEKFNSQENRSIILAYTVQDENNGTDFLDDPPFELLTSMIPSQISPNQKDLAKKRIESFNWPINKFIEKEIELGYLNMEEDADGVFRHYTIFANVYSKEMEGSLLLPSLGMRAFMSSLDVNDINIIVKDDGNSYIDFESERININANGETKIRWVGGEEKFQTIPLWRLLEGVDFEEDNKKYKLDEMFKGKTVFIASTATGAHDLRNTSIDPKLPGVFAHMNMVDMLSHKNFYKSQDKSIEYSLWILALGMVILIVTMFFNKAILDIFVLTVLLCTSYAIDYYYFLPEGYEIRLFFTFFAFTSTYSWITFLNFNQANAEKKQIKGAFSRYVAPSIVNDMLDNPDKLKVGGEKRDITCMFSDVRDFTSISEKLSATELATSLNRYMGEMTDIVFETNGTLDKYIGDAIVAFWGAPIDIGDHVNQALDAAVKMLEALPKINEEFKSKNLPEFKIGLGLNSGECSVGNMGSNAIFAYTALGDNMNLGARLESLCKHYGAQILVSEFTFERMDKEKFKYRLIDKVKVKGKNLPVGVYEILYSYHPFWVDEISLNKFKEAYELFIAGEFQKAKDLFEDILEIIHHDKACLRLRESCEEWLKNPPKDGEDWTITTMTTK